MYRLLRGLLRAHGRLILEVQDSFIKQLLLVVPFFQAHVSQVRQKHRQSLPSHCVKLNNPSTHFFASTPTPSLTPLALDAPPPTALTSRSFFCSLSSHLPGPVLTVLELVDMLGRKSAALRTRKASLWWDSVVVLSLAA